MGKSVWKVCSKCKKKTKFLRRFKNKPYCYLCYSKKITLTPNFTINEPIAISVNIPVELTKSQDMLLSKKLKYLFPNLSKKKIRPGITPYIRNLILKDLYENK